MKFNIGGDSVNVHFQLEDMDMLEQILRTVEAQTEERGWDQQPTFYALNRIGETPADSPAAGIVGIAEIRMPPAVYEDPGVMLLQLAREMNTADPLILRAIAPKLVGPQFYALLAFTEAWMVAGEGPAPQLGSDYEYDGVMPRDHPDRKEIRSGIMVTVDGRILMIVRIRGEFPEFYELGEGEGPIETGGRLVDALRMMCTTLHDAVKAP